MTPCPQTGFYQVNTSSVTAKKKRKKRTPVRLPFGKENGLDGWTPPTETLKVPIRILYIYIYIWSLWWTAFSERYLKMPEIKSNQQPTKATTATRRNPATSLARIALHVITANSSGCNKACNTSRCVKWSQRSDRCETRLTTLCWQNTTALENAA